METTKTKTEIPSRSTEKLFGNNGLRKPGAIMPISTMSELLFTMPRILPPAGLEKMIFENISRLSIQSRSQPDGKNAAWKSSSPGEATRTEIPKISSGPSPTPSSQTTNISEEESTLIPFQEKEDVSILSSLSDPKNADAPDLLYILGRGSKWRNNEIRFSLRSVEKYLPHARIFIVGECPKFLRNVVHIPAIDPYENKIANAIFKIRAACREIDLSERFILMNDDFFLLRPIKRIEPMILGTLSDALANHSTKAGYYFNAIRKTQDLISAAGQKALDYEVHAPMILEKQKFLSLTDAVEWTEGFLFRSLYGNTFEIGGKKRKDTKVHRIDQLEDLAQYDIISTADRVVLRPEFQHFIYNLFPTPCRYEDPATDPGRMP